MCIRDSNTAGKVAIGMDFKICDPESGDDLPPGTPGEVVIRGPSLTPGYWRAPDKTRDLFRDGWMRTGDVGLVDEEGFLTIVDRVKDMIISGGENIFAGEVENVSIPMQQSRNVPLLVYPMKNGVSAYTQ